MPVIGIALTMVILFKIGALFTGVALVKCKEVKKIYIDNEINNLNRHLQYVLSTTGRSVVHFQFNLNIKNNEETLFSILSNQTRRLVYLGSYKHNLSLEIDANLSMNNGYDNLEFQLLRLGQKQICNWANESDYPYWHANAKIEIDFLDKGIFDEEGLFKQFEVNIRS